MPQELIRVAHSPDSDDAFMFYALAKDKIDTGPFRFEHTLADIETLNHAAQNGTYEVSAISFHAFPKVSERYALLPSGSSIEPRHCDTGSAPGRIPPARISGSPAVTRFGA